MSSVGSFDVCARDAEMKHAQTKQNNTVPLSRHIHTTKKQRIYYVINDGEWQFVVARVFVYSFVCFVCCEESSAYTVGNVL